MLGAAIEEEAHGSLRLAGEMERDDAVVARAELGAEAAAGELADHAHLALRQLEQRGDLVLHAVDPLRAGVERRTVLAPVGDHAVRLNGGMRLHFGPVFLLESDLAAGERLLHVAVIAADHRAAHVSLLRNVLRGATTAGGALLFDRALENERCAGLAGVVDIGHVRKHLVLDANGARRILRLRRGGCSHGGNGRTLVPDVRVLVGVRAG